MPTKKSTVKDIERSERQKKIWAARKANVKKALARKEAIAEATPSPVVELSVLPKADIPVPALSPVEAFLADPRCLCGCGAELPKSKKIEKASLFKPGHDARLHGIALKVIRGKGGQVPEVAKVMRQRIGFLAKHPELAPAFD